MSKTTPPLLNGLTRYIETGEFSNRLYQDLLSAVGRVLRKGLRNPADEGALADAYQDFLTFKIANQVEQVRALVDRSSHDDTIKKQLHVWAENLGKDKKRAHLRAAGDERAHLWQQTKGAMKELVENGDVATGPGGYFGGAKHCKRVPFNPLDAKAQTRLQSLLEQQPTIERLRHSEENKASPIARRVDIQRVCIAALNEMAYDFNVEHLRDMVESRLSGGGLVGHQMVSLTQEAEDGSQGQNDIEDPTGLDLETAIDHARLKGMASHHADHFLEQLKPADRIILQHRVLSDPPCTLSDLGQRLFDAGFENFKKNGGGFKTSTIDDRAKKHQTSIRLTITRICNQNSVQVNTDDGRALAKAFLSVVREKLAQGP